MLVESIIRSRTEYPSTEFENMPIIIQLTVESEYVAAGNRSATQLGIRKGMLLDLVKYFCWKPLIITVNDISEIPFEILNKSI